MLETWRATRLETPMTPKASVFRNAPREGATTIEPRAVMGVNRANVARPPHNRPPRGN